jgi:glucose/arabinose dehydrogenase
MYQALIIYFLNRYMKTPLTQYLMGTIMPVQHFLQTIASRFTFILLFISFITHAQNLPNGFSQVMVANGISNPTVMAFAPDGRIFVAQQNGQLRIIKNGSLLSQPFISLSVSSSGERGLLGIAFDPNFSSNNYIYLYYTLSSGSNNRISRFTANGDVVAQGSEQVLLNLDPLSGATNHNGGTMMFGPDGKLYIGVGENADASYSQRTDTYHGKLLRINPDGSVPSGNPFSSGGDQQRRIWAYGLRNPFTIAFQPGTGRLFVNDVGASSWEEINDATTGGKNFGWPQAEGYSDNSSFADPIYAYGRGSGCAITGGTFFSPSSTNYPSTYTGRYFFIDFCNNWIDMLTLNGGSASRSNFASNIAGSPVSLTTGTDGNLYFLSRDNGAVYRIAYAGGSSAPVITTQPQNITVAQGNSATFRVTATGTAPLSYQWRKNGTNINGATSSSYTISNPTANDAGNFSVVVSNSAGSVTSNSATLTVTSPNQAPVATITSPAAGSTYAGGDVISFSGSATDAEQGTLGGGSFTWYVIFHHDTHTHPGPTATTGAANGSFTIPNSGETASNVFYRLYLIVTDAQGARDTVYRDITPRTSSITLNTNPQGLTITLDGQPFTAPLTVTSVEGIVRAIGTTSPQTLNSQTYNFSNWSNGGAQTHSFVTPVNNVSYTANFTVAATLPVITQQPQNFTISQGNNASFHVTASGTAPLSYQWRKNGVNIAGATNSSLTITDVSTADAGNYSVVVSNAAGSVTSSTGTLTVTSLPVITSQPESITVGAGNSATFRVNATGTAPLAYQWRRNGVNINGATAASYTISYVATANAGNYSVVVSNGYGSTTSTVATLTVTTAPLITTQPQSVVAVQGATASFRVTATGTSPLTYQWRRNGVNINGATAASYTVSAVTTANAGNYSVVVSNEYGSATSNTATLTVTTVPVITAQPQSITVVQGTTASFSVTATGTAPLAYQWRRNGVNIPGANSTSYTISSVTTANAGNYSVVVSNEYGSATSNTATLTVTTVPVITAQPQSKNVVQGATVSFNVTASGTSPMSYQWRKNGVNISGAASTSYSIASVTAADAGNYSVVVSNAYGSATSNNANLVVTSRPNTAPVARIVTPVQGTTYAGGQVINFSGTATDAEDGNLSPASLDWSVRFYHNDHAHAGPTVSTGVSNGSFTIPASGETAADVFYRIYLVVTDEQGAKDTAYTDILPRTSVITLNTNPQGLTVSLDGQLYKAPLTATSVEGILRTIGVVSPQAIDTVTYNFTNWSHGGTQTQTIATPSNDTNYIAVFDSSSLNTPWLREPDSPYNITNGLDYAYYHGTWDSLPDFSKLYKQQVGTVSNFDLSPRTENSNFAFRYSGYIYVQADGIYTFYTSSDEGSRLYIGDSLIVDNDSLHTIQERSGQIGLKAGLHQLTVTFFEKTGEQQLYVSYEAADVPKQLIPDSVLFREQPINYVFTPIADAYVRSGTYTNVNISGGATTSLYTSGDAPEEYQTYLRFDISSLGNDVSSARLRLYGGLNNASLSSAIVEVYNVPQWNGWLENTISYANKTQAEPTMLTSATITSSDSQYYEWDLTQYIINRRSAGAKYISLMLKNNPGAGDNIVYFNSRENDNNKPELVVVTNQAVTQARPAATGYSNPITKGVKTNSSQTPTFSIYPNPVNSNFTIKYSPELGNRKLQVTDISGKVLKELLLTGAGIQTVRADDLKQGFYFLNIYHNNKKYSQKIIVTR